VDDSRDRLRSVGTRVLSDWLLVRITAREGEVLALIGQGLSNKEIARELTLSVATVKHHVHHILEKLKLARRAEAMRRVRDAPWLASPVESRAARGVADR